MLHIRIVAVGTIKETFFESAIAEYTKRLQKYCKLEIVQIKESISAREAKDIAEKLKGYVVLFDVQGEMISSKMLSDKIANISMNNSCITFVIGGSDGVGGFLDGVVNEKVSFGRITMPHQLFRVVAVEQIYRAFTIQSGTPYHK